MVASNFFYRFLASKREACLKEEYGSNIPAHLLVPPVGPNQVKTRDSGIGS